jgi:hypothetical protein
MVFDLQPGRRGSNPYEAAWSGEKLFVSATTEAYGQEVWALGGEVTARQLSYVRTEGGASTPQAVATDKRALLPGESASFANVSNFASGLTGVVIEIRSAHGVSAAVAPSDFEIRTGAVGDPAAWAPGPVPVTATVAKGAGALGTDRVVLSWAEGAIRNTWLQVTAKANARTGLDRPDVFYFGSLVGETGNGRNDPRVDAFDVALTRANVGNVQPAAVNRFDFDRNGRIDVVDVLIARSNAQRRLRLLVAPTSVATGSPEPVQAVPVPSSPARRSAARRSWLALDAGTVDLV